MESRTKRSTAQPRQTSGISFFTLARNGRRLTLRISVRNEERNLKDRFEAGLETGVMRGHQSYTAMAENPSKAVQKCLALISGGPAPDPTDNALVDQLLRNELVTDEIKAAPTDKELSSS